MKKFISFNASENETGGVDINIDVLENGADLAFVACGGYIESSDLADLYTPAAIMVHRLVGYPDADLVDKVVAAFEAILTPEPENTVSINGERFA